MVKINKALNLVIPVRKDDEVYYVYSAPIRREAFEKYFLVLTKAYTELAGNGLLSQGARISTLMLKQVADDLGKSHHATEILQEIRRLSNVIACAPSGWESIPLNVAVERELIDPDDVFEIEGHQVFFTLISLVPTKNQAEEMLSHLPDMLGWLLTSSTPMEYIAGLPTLTETANTGKSRKA